MPKIKTKSSAKKRFRLTAKGKEREMQHTNLGNELMDRIINDTSTIGKVEVHPKSEGRQMVMIIQPI